MDFVIAERLANLLGVLGATTKACVGVYRAVLMFGLSGSNMAAVGQRGFLL